ncbi:MAG: AAA family ATPase [Thermus sp.]|uniref:AAA family ATPase n=1 Tax=Thermus TaxID=270 RepID=UPI001F0EFA86|nr:MULTISPECIES: AAA family ATPase [Thermus]
MEGRHVGKTTLVRNLPSLSQHLYLTLGHLDLPLQAEADPRALLSREDKLILDEVQRVPELLLAIKRSVDEARIPGHFVLTGSAHLLLHAHLAETLAGRAAHLVLWPMTWREHQGLGKEAVLLYKS